VSSELELVMAAICFGGHEKKKKLDDLLSKVLRHAGGIVKPARNNLTSGRVVFIRRREQA
jgi:hypothetical protein